MTAQWAKQATACGSSSKRDGTNYARHIVEVCCALRDRTIGKLTNAVFKSSGCVDCIFKLNVLMVLLENKQ